MNKENLTQKTKRKVRNQLIKYGALGMLVFGSGCATTSLENIANAQENSKEASLSKKIRRTINSGIKFEDVWKYNLPNTLKDYNWHTTPDKKIIVGDIKNDNIDFSPFTDTYAITSDLSELLKYRQDMIKCDPSSVKDLLKKMEETYKFHEFKVITDSVECDNKEGVQRIPIGIFQRPLNICEIVVEQLKDASAKDIQGHYGFAGILTRDMNNFYETSTGDYDASSTTATGRSGQSSGQSGRGGGAGAGR